MPMVGLWLSDARGEATRTELDARVTPGGLGGASLGCGWGAVGLHRGPPRGRTGPCGGEGAARVCQDCLRTWEGGGLGQPRGAGAGAPEGPASRTPLVVGGPLLLCARCRPSDVPEAGPVAGALGSLPAPPPPPTAQRCRGPPSRGTGCSSEELLCQPQGSSPPPPPPHPRWPARDVRLEGPGGR